MFRSSKPKCFYCGRRSTQKLGDNVRMFKCEHCEAKNHLDSNGQITDPPVLSTSSTPSVRYARAPSASAFQSSNTTSTSLFCDTCLKNQHLYQQNLASYLPHEASPDYAKYLQSYEAYDRKLQQRYPQVCSQCAPQVRETIKKAGYVAKTDFLQRMVERSRNGKFHRTKDWHYRWRSFVLGIAGVGWYTSIFFQVAYHLVQADRTSTFNFDDGSRPGKYSSKFLFRPLGISNLHDFVDLEKYVPQMLFIAALTMWWNPKLREKYLESGGRMVKMFDYYSVQVIVLIVRIVGFLTLKNPSTLQVEAFKGINAFLAVFLLIITLISKYIVHIDTRTLVSFHANDSDILPDVPDQAPNIQNLLKTSTPSQQFPISSLAPKLKINPLTSTETQSMPSTPDNNEYEAMDWSPSVSTIDPSFPTQTFQATNLTSMTPSGLFSSLNINGNDSRGDSHRSGIFTDNGSSPFKTAVPPAPLQQMHHARLSIKPVSSTGPFQKASPAQQASFSQGFGVKKPQTYRDVFGREVEETSDSDSDADVVTRRKQRREIRLSTPKFWPQGQAVETGLESMFDEVFRFADEPFLEAKTGNSPASHASTTTPSEGGKEKGPTGRPEKGSSLTFTLFVGSIPALLVGALVMTRRMSGSHGAFSPVIPPVKDSVLRMVSEPSETVQ